MIVHYAVFLDVCREFDLRSQGDGYLCIRDLDDDARELGCLCLYWLVSFVSFETDNVAHIDFVGRELVARVVKVYKT